MDLGKIIKSWRKKLDLSQEGLGNKIGVDTATISRWENGKNAPNVENITKLAQALGITESDLLDSSDIDMPSAYPDDTPTSKATARKLKYVAPSGNIVYEWGEGRRLELPDTPDNRDAILRLIERLETLAIQASCANIEQDEALDGSLKNVGASQTA